MSDDLRVVPSVASGVRDRLLAVRALGILQGLDDDAALLLAEYSKVTSFEAGEEVTSADHEAKSVHVVLEGRLQVPLASGGSIAIESGRGVGVIGVLADAGKNLRSFADLPTRTLEISKEAFFAVLDESFSVVRNILKIFAGMILDARGALPADPEVPSGEPLAERRKGPRTLVERVLELSVTGIFANANVDPIFDMARLIREVQLPPRHVLFRSGDPPRTTFRVLEGTVRCTAPFGRSVEVAGGQLLGGLASFAGRNHAYEAITTTDVVAYEMQFEDTLMVLETHPELAMNLLSMMAKLLLAAPGASNSGLLSSPTASRAPHRAP